MGKRLQIVRAVDFRNLLKIARMTPEEREIDAAATAPKPR